MVTVAGVSTLQGKTKVRFSRDLVHRVKMLTKEGHTDIDFVNLPGEMTKLQACEYLRDNCPGIMAVARLADAVNAACDKYAKTEPRSARVNVSLEDLRSRAQSVKI